MELADVKQIGVVGAGTMGHGIAINFALAGYPVLISDMSEAILERSKKNIRNALDLFVDVGPKHRIEFLHFANDRRAPPEPRERIGCFLDFEQLRRNFLAVERLGHLVGGVLDCRIFGRALLKGMGGYRRGRADEAAPGPESSGRATLRSACRQRCGRTTAG